MQLKNIKIQFKGVFNTKSNTPSYRNQHIFYSHEKKSRKDNHNGNLIKSKKLEKFLKSQISQINHEVEQDQQKKNNNIYKGMTLQEYMRGNSRLDQSDEIDIKKQEILQYEKNFKIEQTDQENYNQSQRQSRAKKQNYLIKHLPHLPNPSKLIEKNGFKPPLKTQISQQFNDQKKRKNHPRFPTMCQEDYVPINSVGRSKTKTFYKKNEFLPNFSYNRTKNNKVGNGSSEQHPVFKITTLANFYRGENNDMTKTQKGKFGNNLGYATKYNSTFKNFVNGKK